MEIHYFAIPNVGYNEGIKCNYIKVVVVPNTNNILTMYPIDTTDTNLAIQLNIDFSTIFNKTEEKVKMMSRIDKFNMKYKR